MNKRIAAFRRARAYHLRHHPATLLGCAHPLCASRVQWLRAITSYGEG